MPIRPNPMTFYCPTCKWSITTRPRSDALTPVDYFSKCPKCGNEQLERRKPSLLDELSGVLDSLTGKSKR